ncbi:MAG: DsrE family protein [Gammaproteobacteria bacterium]|nr:DsrE family protein [Gammaproteobacteria bacterium]MDH5736042.1 DsrE family protein [Gammaproteobacteria bacterium]
MKKLFICIGLLMYLCSTQQLLAASGDKPFAEEKIVLQISDADPDKQTLILNVSNNLIKHYGPDKVDIEVIAFGPGLRLLFKNNSNSGRIDDLNESGVRFSACGNTLQKMTALLGEKPALNSKASLVTAGVVRIIELQNQGYKLIKP